MCGGGGGNAAGSVGLTVDENADQPRPVDERLGV